MRTLFLLAVLASIISCNTSNDKKIIPNKNDRVSTTKDIIGIWELLKRSYRPSNEPSLVQASDKEYLEIKSDGNCQDGPYPAKWFLSYTDDFVIDSTSKIIFSELTNTNPGSYDDYNRKIKPYQIKISTDNGIKYLYLTSLQTSETRIYIRKN
jgi:hypothetical protein